MFSEEEMRELFERVMDAMVVAGWLERYIRSNAKGWHLYWSEGGATWAISLNQIVGTFGLAKGDANAMLFSEIAQGDRALAPLGISGELDIALAAFWLNALEVLGFLASDSNTFDHFGSRAAATDLLQAFAHVIAGWAPDKPNTRIVFR